MGKCSKCRTLKTFQHKADSNKARKFFSLSLSSSVSSLEI